MLKRLYAHNFRTFVNFEWKPPPASVLVGVNGVGKTALLEVIWLLQEIVVDGRNVNDTPLRSAVTEWSSEAKQVIEVDLDYDDESYSYRLECNYEAARSELSEVLRAGPEVLYSSSQGKASLFGDDEPSLEPRTTIPFDRRRSFLAVLEPRPDNRRLVRFRDAVRSIWALKPNPQKLIADAGDESPELARDLANFASWYRGRVQEDPDAADKLRGDLRQVVPGFELLRLAPVAANVKELRVQFRFGPKSHELAWANLSDGQRQIIALYAVLRFGLPRASLIALDEVENYVAPSEIQPWLRAVADFARDGGRQLLVISHHPEAIDYLAADSIWRMWRDKEGGHSRIEPLEADRAAGESAYEAVRRDMADA